ncbi:P-loop containing nucleoside triphosphate hydrolase protein [Cristinia sonorae]|uniref:P-loop containing nucleoside triphosphate hydrolase protein n=1 Tax=Cristinia sonorae TaxID=1940300 RepID=A0A8K0XUA9_9AGAR|nr:P-loop containing nucleoside triphosphate hydrolase protein [Cristinia sonorae]
MPGDVLKKRKIAVLGSRSVGKSSLVVQFIENHFVESYYPTIESTFTKSINYKGVEYDCDIIDTAGQVKRLFTVTLSRNLVCFFQDEYTILNSKHAIGIHGYILVYSVTSRKSFDMVQVVYDKIVNFCGLNSIPCVIVGSKTDLQQSTSRQVPANEGQELANNMHAAWVETSAKTNCNVECSAHDPGALAITSIAKVFELCLGEIEKRTPSNKTEPPASKCIVM